MAAILIIGGKLKFYNANRLTDPENLYIPGFKGIIEETKIRSKKKFSRQVAAILIIGGKLKI